MKCHFNVKIVESENVGDVVLPEVYLEDLMKSQYYCSSKSVALKISSNGGIIYAGTREFHNKRNIIIIPKVLAQDMNVVNGDRVLVETFLLPVVEYMKIKIYEHNKQVDSIPKYLMEEIIQKYTAIKKNQKIYFESKTPMKGNYLDSSYDLSYIEFTSLWNNHAEIHEGYIFCKDVEVGILKSQTRSKETQEKIFTPFSGPGRSLRD